MGARSKVLVLGFFSVLLLIGIGLPARAQEGDVENGKVLFGEYCAVCHGYDGQGRVGASLEGWFPSIEPEAFVRSTVSSGVAGTMPAFAQSNGGPLTEEQIDDIAVYILSWRERVAPAPTPTPVPVTPIPTIAGMTGDPTAGAQVFARECQVCHGERGQGGIGASLSNVIASNQPAAFIRQVVTEGVEGSPMPAFGAVLGEDEVENVVAYVLSWERRPAPQTTPEPEEGGDFNWLVALLFILVVLIVMAWLIIRLSRRQTSA
jgi:cytochrome c oxidase cbb3-type subunit 3